MKPSKLCKTFLLLAALSLSGLAFAQWANGARPAAPAPTTEQQLLQGLQARFGKDMHIDNLRKTEHMDLYEFRVNGRMGYTDANLRYIFLGNLIDGATMNSLTDARMAELDRIPFDQLPLQLAVKTVRGNGKRKLAIFEDPNCGYCKLFQKEIRSVDNITIYSFIYPILAPDSVTKARRILCSANPSQAWQDWMVYGRMAEGKGDCKTNIEQIAKFGQDNNISSTPTFFVASGERFSGALEVEKLEQIFKEQEK
ncbi:MAG: DsbC family protein [Burkholderiaceae bacterium]|nr:MAG: DsbC family protein [Burkholderiaceae bacterium]